ncbi:MAG TPA: o-succinylbenzoate--CoA ligase [Microlunatus sp.]|nr:o-succinylbenzoate--CoA ligase [Microlunatus sp.]
MITPAALRTAYATGDSIELATSGTSGRARRVLRTAASWVDSFDLVAGVCDLDAASRAWVPGPVTASMNAYAVCLVDHVGGSLAADPSGASHVFCTPSSLDELLADERRPGPLVVVVAGDRLPPRLATRAEAAGHTVHHYYGAAQLSFVGWGRDADSLRLFPRVRAESRDGELWVSSPWLCLSEDGDPPVLTSEVRDGRTWMTVGDRGSVSADGRLVVTGRADAVTTGGATVVLSDVEAALRPYARGEVVVFGRPHRRLGSVLVAVCTDAVDTADLPAVARRVLPASHRPRRWSVLEELPVTAAGKVDRDRIAAG